MIIRIKFHKLDRARYLGHLDLMRFFQRALRRAGFPLEYSKGFHPHPVISFAQPLSVGFTSKGEYFDVKLTEEIDTEFYKEALNKEMIPGIFTEGIVSLKEPAKKAMSLVFAADYLAEFKSDIDFSGKIPEFLLKDEIILLKKTKKGETKINIRPHILSMTCAENGVIMRVRCGSEANLNPKNLIELFIKDYCGGKVEDLKITRLDTLAEGESGPVSLFNI